MRQTATARQSKCPVAKAGRVELQFEIDKEKPFTAWFLPNLTTQRVEDP